ncbi:hypothetical protein CXB45_04830 [Corynebacterium mastitidis]|uniref:DUF4259 domain-containing protein n=2 Tax=Corynebacterium mastitidis TaxID=161890 RepID=A0A2N0X7X8_9CORY|nr:hypothetical protein CXB45_04830 [Corynebacterium mastitidis]
MAALVRVLESRAAGTGGDAVPEVGLGEIFEDLGLEGLGGNYTDAALDHGDAFLLAAALGAVVARAKAGRGAVDLATWGGRGRLELRSDVHRVTQLATAMKYFALNPEDHRAERDWDEDTLVHLADEAESLRGRLD